MGNFRNFYTFISIRNHFDEKLTVHLIKLKIHEVRRKQERKTIETTDMSVESIATAEFRNNAF